MQTTPTPRFIDLQLDVPEFTHVSDAEASWPRALLHVQPTSYDILPRPGESMVSLRAPMHETGGMTLSYKPSMDPAPVPDPELIKTQVLPKLLSLRSRAMFCELPLTREGCRYFRGGDGSDVPSAGIILHQTDFAFLPV
jgi:hypothetical protein